MSEIIQARQIYEIVCGEDHTDECDGTKVTFYTQKTFRLKTVKIWINGLLQRPVHYAEDANGTYITLSFIPHLGDEFVIDYVVR